MFLTRIVVSHAAPPQQLREWQREAFAAYRALLEAGGRTALWEATPGAGKTQAALRVIRHQLLAQGAKRAVVVVPTSHLRVQWARAAARVGVVLDCTFSASRRRLTREFHGAVVTYQQFGNALEVFRELASDAVVVLDEVHHAGDGLTWGNAVRAALEPAKFILTLSGTAFRSDNNPIPFVRYDEDGQSSPDYSYSYARAVEEGVCRPTAVFTYGGEVSWSEQGVALSARFSDPLDPIASARRLRAALDPDSGWIEPMLRDAHEMLRAVRHEHPRAGALLVCADRDHARQMARLVTTVSGCRPTVVLSDDSGASRKIKQFTDSDAPWIVACNMVSEGVDIPRLRIGVYATTIRTKMYFRQFLGRIVRRQPEPSGLQVAYLYLPADPTLHRLAEEIEAESRHVLRRSDDAFGDERAERVERVRDDEGRAWMALTAVNSGIDSVLVHGNQLALFGGAVPAHEVREVVQREVAQQLGERLTKSEIKQQLASEVQRLVGLLHRRRGLAHALIHRGLNRIQSVASQVQCSEAQLRTRRILLERLLAGERIPQFEAVVGARGARETVRRRAAGY